MMRVGLGAPRQQPHLPSVVRRLGELSPSPRPSTRATSARNRAVMVARSTTAVTLPTAGSETTEVQCPQCLAANPTPGTHQT